MAAQLVFDLLAKDHASQTFAKVGRSAQTLGNTLESTSSRGSRTFARMGTAAHAFGRTLGKVAKAGAIGGALIGAGMAAASPNVL